MPVSAQVFQNQVNSIDSSGLSYSSYPINLSLKKDFLQVEFINHSLPKSADTSSTSDRKNSVKGEKSTTFSFEYSDFVLILLLGLFTLLAYIRLTGRNYFNRLIMSVRNYTYSVSFYREKNLAFVLYKNMLILVFYISSGLLASVMLKYFNLPAFHPDPIVQMLILSGIIALLILLNRLLVRISGFLFVKNRLASEYLFYYGNLLRVSGLGFLLINVGLFFINKEAEFVFIYLALFIGFITYFVKLIRILIIFFNNRFSLYYLILYFCALEIIPVVLLIKLFLFYMQNGIKGL